jgi:hypothetical protein
MRSDRGIIHYHWGNRVGIRGVDDTAVKSTHSRGGLNRSTIHLVQDVLYEIAIALARGAVELGN